MANNRIYLHCDGCGEDLCLGKHMGSIFSWDNYSKKKTHLEDVLNEFYYEHTWCGEVDTPIEHFSIRYEISPEEIKKADEETRKKLERWRNMRNET